MHTNLTVSHSIQSQWEHLKHLITGTAHHLLDQTLEDKILARMLETQPPGNNFLQVPEPQCLQVTAVPGAETQIMAMTIVYQLDKWHALLSTKLVTNVDYFTTFLTCV